MNKFDEACAQAVGEKIDEKAGDQYIQAAINIVMSRISDDLAREVLNGDLNDVIKKAGAKISSSNLDVIASYVDNLAQTARMELQKKLPKWTR